MITTFYNARILSYFRSKYERIALTSIGGAPVHNGHVRLLTQAKDDVWNWMRNKGEKTWGIDTLLFVLVNSDRYCIEKHGWTFQNEDERAEIIDGIKDVDVTFIYDTKSTIERPILKIVPDFFLKGGDRTEENTAKIEKDACRLAGCEILYNVGGGKVASSSELLLNWHKNYIVPQLNGA